jgi:hypothetical protein
MQIHAKVKLAASAKMKIRDLDDFHSTTCFMDSEEDCVAC